MGLSRPGIVAAAIEILQAYGLADVTMRRVAETLQVQAGALYWHVPNKQTLLALMSDEILGQVATPDGAVVPGEWLTSWSHQLLAVLRSYRDSAELVSAVLASGLGGVDPIAAPRQLLCQAGAPEPVAAAATHALLQVVLGSLVVEQSRAQLAELGVSSAEPAVDSGAVEMGIQLVIEGVLARLPKEDGKQ